MNIDAGSVENRGMSNVLTVVPPARTVGGRLERKSLADLERCEKGLNFAVISVMNLVIIVRVVENVVVVVVVVKLFSDGWMNRGWS